MAYVNGGKFRVQTEAEQQVWNECSRLIINAIIYYNSALLSRVYAQKHSAQDQAAMEVIQGMSPVASQHINLIGQFEFSVADSKVDIDALVERYADPDCWNKSLQPAVEVIWANFTFGGLGTISHLQHAHIENDKINGFALHQRQRGLPNFGQTYLEAQGANQTAQG